MNNYITLDTYKYAVTAKNWESHPIRPASADPMLNGETAVTFGPATWRVWTGSIKAAVTPASGYGSIVNFRATMEKLQTVAYTDVYGNTFTVLATVKGPEISISPMWDAADNEFTQVVELRQVL